MNTNILENITQKYKSNFPESEYLRVFSPGRINLIGEHTDYNQGFVFPAAINKGIYAVIGKAESDSTIIAEDINQSFSFTTAAIQPQKETWKNYVLGVVTEYQKKGIHIPNFTVIFSGDIPQGAGLSSSAALENAVAFGLNELFQLQQTKEELIHISQKAEHNYVGVKCGIMDQFASMFGKINKAILLDCQSMTSEYFPLDLKEYTFLLINTNVKHSLADSAYNDRRKACETVATVLSKTSLREASLAALNENLEHISVEDYRKAQYVIEENYRVQEAAKALTKTDLKLFGELLYASHKGLSEKYQVSCTELDFLIDLAKTNKNVLGARMMGGGFGGCTINLIHKDEVNNFSEQVKTAYENKLAKVCSIYKVNIGEGTRIV